MKTFEKGQTVEAPEPIIGYDLYNHSFVGTVVGIRGDLTTVEDMDGDCFDIETERLTLIED